MSSRMTRNQAAAELGLGLNFSVDDVKKAYKKTALAWYLARPLPLPLRTRPWPPFRAKS